MLINRWNVDIVKPIGVSQSTGSAYSANNYDRRKLCVHVILIFHLVILIYSVYKKCKKYLCTYISCEFREMSRRDGSKILAACVENPIANMPRTCFYSARSNKIDFTRDGRIHLSFQTSSVLQLRRECEQITMSHISIPSYNSYFSAFFANRELPDEKQSAFVTCWSCLQILYAHAQAHKRLDGIYTSTRKQCSN